MKLTINNGKSVDVRLSDFSGRAGFVDKGETAELAYKPVKPIGGPGVGATIEVDGRKWTVTAVATSVHAAGLRVLTLKSIQESQS